MILFSLTKVKNQELSMLLEAKKEKTKSLESEEEVTPAQNLSLSHIRCLIQMQVKYIH